MKKRMLLIMIVALALFTMACSWSFTGFPDLMRGSVSASGEVVREERDISAEVTEVEISGNGYLYFTQGETAELVVEGDSNYVDDIETRISGNKLIIRPKTTFFFSWFRDVDEVTYYLTLPELEEVTSSGALDVILGDLNAGNLKLNFSGSSDLTAGMVDGEDISITSSGSSDLSVETFEAKTVRFKTSGSNDLNVESIFADEVSINSSGSADMVINTLEAEFFNVDASGSTSLLVEEGTVTSQSIEMSGSGTYYAPNLESKSANLDGSGSSNFTLWVTDTLTISTSGSSQISYYGDPEITNSSTNILKLDRE